jgi:hypothetical protein
MQTWDREVRIVMGKTTAFLKAISEMNASKNFNALFRLVYPVGTQEMGAFGRYAFIPQMPPLKTRRENPHDLGNLAPVAGAIPRNNNQES